MNLDFRILHLTKRFPLRISRGTITGSDNLFVSVTRNGLVGWGEMAHGSSEGAASASDAQSMLSGFWTDEGLARTDVQAASIREIHQRAMDQGIAPCALAALDCALWDLLGHEAGLPLYRLLGASRPKVPTSITIGINPPDVVRERVPRLLAEGGFKSLKVKLGSPDGIDADKAMFEQVAKSAAPYQVNLRVDANGGWDVDEARHMMAWLAERNTDYVEQPLAEGREVDLPKIFHDRPLPIYVDESCRFASDIPRFAHAVDGVNLKLMKCGGITGALGIIEVARAHQLRLMIGCMGESSMSISAGAALTGMIDHVDLDSHLNLEPDPCIGAVLIDGIVTPTDDPGHGARFCCDGVMHDGPEL